MYREKIYIDLLRFGINAVLNASQLFWGRGGGRY